jgi:hypothetical protein
MWFICRQFDFVLIVVTHLEGIKNQLNYFMLYIVCSSFVLIPVVYTGG